jgi:Spy/CpxP family protein refolding chaperone
MTRLVPSVLLIAGCAALTWAKPPCHGPAEDSCSHERTTHHRIWEKLELDAQQKEQLKTLHEQARQRRKDHFTEVRTIKGDMKDELLKDTPDRAVLDRYADKLGQLRTRETKEEIAHLLDIKKVLNREQFETLMHHRGKFRKPGSHGHKKDMPAEHHRGGRY